MSHKRTIPVTDAGIQQKLNQIQKHLTIIEEILWLFDDSDHPLASHVKSYVQESMYQPLFVEHASFRKVSDALEKIRGDQDA